MERRETASSWVVVRVSRRTLAGNLLAAICQDERGVSGAAMGRQPTLADAGVDHAPKLIPAHAEHLVLLLEGGLTWPRDASRSVMGS